MELKPADKVKLIKEVKNFVPGVNLVQVRRGLPEAPATRRVGPKPTQLLKHVVSSGLSSLFKREPGFLCLGE